MHLHHLSCATQCIQGGRLISGHGFFFHTVAMVAHCLLIETESGLVLVDTGLGCDDVRSPRSRLSWGFRLLSNPILDQRNTAFFQVEQLGYQRSDVRHIILTHLDLDHAGGISDFPQAQVHLLESEFQAARAKGGWIHQFRYRPAQWQHHAHWITYQPNGEKWFGFEAVRSLQGLPPEILLIPLPGHTRGHAGIAIQTTQGWVLHAGDSYFHRDELNYHCPTCPLGLRLFQIVLAADYQACLKNQQRLRQLIHREDSSIQIFSSHDPTEFKHLESAGACR
jgi:glyoxylase-like metal-dependent hydrolase (beta-lactamase superfamily II)